MRRSLQHLSGEFVVNMKRIEARASRRGGRVLERQSEFVELRPVPRRESSSGRPGLGLHYGTTEARPARPRTAGRGTGLNVQGRSRLNFAICILQFEIF